MFEITTEVLYTTFVVIIFAGFFVAQYLHKHDIHPPFL